MKIDQDLRAAIRSADKAQPDNHDVRSNIQQAAVEELFKRKPSTKQAWERAKRLRQTASDFGSRANAIESALGISFYCSKFNVRDEEAFAKAGGNMKPAGKRWKFDAVMAELAAAEPKQLTAILKKYGINWK